MTVFWGLAGIMLIVALLFTLPWLLRSQRQTGYRPGHRQYRGDQGAARRARGRPRPTAGSTRRQYLAARQDLERELLTDLSGPSAGRSEVKVRSGRWAALLLIVLIPGLTIGLYQLHRYPADYPAACQGRHTCAVSRPRHRPALPLRSRKWWSALPRACSRSRTMPRAG